MARSDASRSWWVVRLALLLLVGVRPAAAETITGQVRGSDGTPVAAGTVWWIAPKADQPVLVAQATTDEGGAFRLEAARAIAWEDVLAAHAPGLALGWQRAVPAADEPLTLAPAAEVRVRLLSTPELDGADVPEPLPGLPVSVDAVWTGALNALTLPVPKVMADTFTVVTDTDGWATFPWLARGQRAQLAVADPAYADRQRSLSIGVFDDVVAVDRLVDRGGTIIGRVEDAATREPIVGARVRALVPNRGGATTWVTTDAQGDYVLERLHPGWWYLEAALPEPLALERAVEFSQPVMVRPDDVLTGVDLSAVPGALLKGRVLDAETDEPVPGVTVTFTRPRPPFGERTQWGKDQAVVSDADGRFRLRLPGTWTTITVPWRELPPALAARYNPAELPEYGLNLEPGMVRPMTFRLPRHTANTLVELQVLDEAGQPVADAHVVAEVLEQPVPDERPEAWVHAGGHHGRSDADGRLRYALAPSEHPRQVKLIARTADTATPEPVLWVPGQVAELRLQPNVFARLRGRVVDEAGQPIAGADVLASHLASRPTGWAMSDNDGWFVVADVWPDADLDSLLTEAPGFVRARLTYRDLQPPLAPNTERTLPELVLAYGGTLTGVVVDLANEPLPDARVEAVDVGGGWVRFAQTDEQGRFVLDALPLGEVKLTISHAFGQTLAAAYVRPPEHGPPAQVVIKLPEPPEA